MSLSNFKVVLGALELGRCALIEDVSCYDILDAYFSAGGNEIDTALMYAGGNSEKIIGRYLADRKMRDKVILASKANPFTNPLSREGVLQQANTSLNSLKTSYMDIFYLHAPDHNISLEETLGAVQELYKEGKFKELGLSNYASWEVVDVYHICKRNGWILPTVYQGMYNAITRSVEAELLPALRHFGIRFYAYNPLAGGLLSGRYQMCDMEKEQDGRFWTVGGKWAKNYRDRYWREETFQGLELVRKALDEVYGEDQVSLVSAAFRWMNHHSQMKDNDAIIIGCSKLNHLVANLGACEEGPLDQKVVEAFNKAWQLDKATSAKYFR